MTGERLIFVWFRISEIGLLLDAHSETRITEVMLNTCKVLPTKSNYNELSRVLLPLITDEIIWRKLSMLHHFFH
jgi:hypothetical protein